MGHDETEKKKKGFYFYLWKKEKKKKKKNLPSGTVCEILASRQLSASMNPRMP